MLRALREEILRFLSAGDLARIEDLLLLRDLRRGMEAGNFESRSAGPGPVAQSHCYSAAGFPVPGVTEFSVTSADRGSKRPGAAPDGRQPPAPAP